MTESFDEFLAKREEAAAAYVRGDGKPVNDLVPHAGDASFHDPGGKTVTGAVEVAERYLADSKSFGAEGASRFEVLQKGSDGSLGFWTGFQIARVKFKGKEVDMRLRVTEVFRNIGGQWKMVHRHADFGALPKG